MSYPKVIHDSWIPFIKHLLDDERLSRLKKILIKEPISPDMPDIFRAFSFPFSELNTVIVGLSPYYQIHYKVRTATGIPFAIPDLRDVEGNLVHYTQSLDRLLEGIVNDTGNIAVEADFDYSLESWCKQGVFLINRSLTVNRDTKDARGHLKYWTWFTKGVLQVINDNKSGIPFAFLGNDAWELSDVVTESNYKKKFSHPAAYSYALQRAKYDPYKVNPNLDIAQQGLFKWIDGIHNHLNGETIQWDITIEKEYF